MSAAVTATFAASITASLTVAVVVEATFCTATEAPIPRLLPGVWPSWAPVGEKLKRNDPAALQIFSSALAATDTSPRPVPVAESIRARVTVVIELTTTEPTTCTLVVPELPAVAPLPLAARPPIRRALVA